MILKRQETDGIIKAIYSSSNICASTYNTTNNDLVVIFNHGGQYRYTNVSKTDYMRFETADSQGSILNTHIKKYASSKMDGVNVDEIMKEVETLKEEDDKHISPEVATKTMLETMNDIIGSYIKSGNITTTSLNELKKGISTYENVTKKEVVEHE
jgi:hypothetical protein